MQAKFSLTKTQLDFINRFQKLGFPDKSAVVRAAIDEFRKQVKQKQLRESARLYAQRYAEDRELQQLTEGAIEDWPE